MAEPALEPQPDNHLETLTQALESGASQQARQLLTALHPAEIAHLLESLPRTQRQLVWEMIDHRDDGEILLHVGDEVRADLIDSMDHQALHSATQGLDLDDLADLLADLPDTVTREVLAGMDNQYRKRLEAVLSYDEDVAGGLMNTDTVTVRADVTLDVVLRYLRMRAEMPSHTDSLVVVDRYDHYLGILPLARVVTREPGLTVGAVMDHEHEGITADTSANQVAKLFEDRDWVSAPVVDSGSRLLGRITIDDIVDVIRKQAEHTEFSMAGLPEEADIFAPVVRSARRRAVWLGANLLTAFLAAGVISLFEGTIDQLVALAVLMPIVASMGGIAGSQTLTLVIRGLALGQVVKGNSRLLLAKEVAVGALNGITWAVVVALIAALWFSSARLGGIIGVAMIINLLTAALAGVSIPLLLRKMHIDPALAGTVILTTVTDVIGFMAFLGLATLLLL